MVSAKKKMAKATLRVAGLLDDVKRFIGRYVVMTEEQMTATVLWVAHTHAFTAFDVTPYLHISGATMRTGKTRLLEVLEVLVPRPWLTGRVTAAVLPRRIDAECPSLLLDESDATFKHSSDYSEALRAILNSGYKHSGSTTVCQGGASYKRYSTFCPKAIAGIGQLPGTIADRSIEVKLKRRAPDENVERFAPRRLGDEVQHLVKRLAAFGLQADNVLQKRHADIDWLNDRAAEVWGPLMAIADCAGGQWPDAARVASKVLSGRPDEQDDDVSTALLFDISEIFSRT